MPGLKVGPANDNWFSLQAGATGELEVVATATSGDARSLQIELTDAKGNVLPAVVTPVVDASGVVTGSQLAFPSVAGQTYLVHVSGGTATIGYSLVLQSLTADLGTTVQGSESGTVAAGGKALYRLEAAVAGSLARDAHPGRRPRGTWSSRSSAPTARRSWTQARRAGPRPGSPRRSACRSARARSS